jgi:lipid II:glycine glycyltransferase (peptidoglycan interpeptide bridge formation enzyme)
MYSIEVDTVNKITWHEIINNFSDANIFQTWSHDEIRFGRKRISHLILKKDGQIVAAAQVRIVKIPFTAIGIAYVFWGPLWKLKESDVNTDIFTQAIRALKSEYAQRRGLLLRINPLLFNDESDVFLPILKNEGFALLQKETPSRTLLVNLSPDLDILRKGLDQKWRNCLNRAMKNDLELLEGDSDEMFAMFIGLYEELIERKKFDESIDINEFRLMQKDLPAEHKMRIILCRFEGNVCVGAVFSSIGNTGLYLFGATNQAGMKSNGSYLIQWKYMEWLKQHRFDCYNLHGINPVTNPGTYKFKAGLCGKNGKDVYFLGKFDFCENKLCEIAIKSGETLLASYKKNKIIMHNLLENFRHVLKKDRAVTVDDKTS